MNNSCKEASRKECERLKALVFDIVPMYLQSNFVLSVAQVLDSWFRNWNRATRRSSFVNEVKETSWKYATLWTLWLAGVSLRLSPEVEMLASVILQQRHMQALELIILACRVNECFCLTRYWKRYIGTFCCGYKIVMMFGCRLDSWIRPTVFIVHPWVERKRGEKVRRTKWKN